MSKKASKPASTKAPAKPKKAGRPRTKIDLVELEKLANMQCTDAEIASWFGLTQKTIQRRKQSAKFSAVLERGRDKGKVSLRQAQFKAALAGNVTAQIWLGKQILEQRDRFEGELTGRGGGPIAVKTCLPEWLLSRVRPAAPGA